MKKIVLFLLLLVWGSAGLQGQPVTVTWHHSQRATAGGTIELLFTASIADSWYIYSVHDVNGPLPTSIAFDGNAGFETVGSLEEGLPSKEKFDEAFEVNIRYYSGKAVFIQKIKRLTEKAFTVSGVIDYQSCSDVQCIPNQYPFTVTIPATADMAPVVSATPPPADSGAGNAPATVATVSPVTPAANDAPAQGEESFWLFIFMAIGAGLACIITPCVFPMIPMTVSFFMSGSKGRRQTIGKALVFWLSVGLVYGMVGVIIALFKSAAMVTFISSHWLPNLLFGLLFILFAASFFGMFEITLPSKWSNNADRQVDKGGIFASFFLAVALACVSFSCTGPFVGSLIGMAIEGTSRIKPIVGFTGFGLALGAPYLIFAIFPALMEKLKSGGWLNAVKVVFAFIMLAFSIKFWIQIENYCGWNILTREVAIAFWIVLAILMGLYVLGKIKFSHDSAVPHVSVGRLVIAIISFVFALYLVPGLFGADLQTVAAFLPAKDRQQFDITAHAAPANAVTGTTLKETPCGNTPKYADTKMHTPAGIKGYFDMEEALACAKQLNRPILVDVTGHGCTNCKAMEASTFKDPRIAELVNAELVWVSLYYDDSTELPAAEQTDKIKTVGKKVQEYQLATFASIGGPYFAVLSADGRVLVKGLGRCNADEFLQFVREGLQQFKNNN